MKVQNIKKSKALVGGLLCIGAFSLVWGTAQVAGAGIIPYPNPGTQNPDVYTFTATSTGDLTGYFAGSGASYDETVGLSVNGAAPTSFGLDDHSSSIGSSFNFGSVTAGDTLVFVLSVNSPAFSPPYVYSNPSLNGPYDYGTAGAGANHVYSTSASAGQIAPSIPAGTYVAFEDEAAPNSDFNYFDDTFVFTDVSTTNSVPDSASSMMFLGMAMTGICLLRRRMCV